MRAYKLFSVYPDGSIGSLFINKRQRIKVGVWYEAEEKHRKQGFAYRPGWHCLPKPEAPHLSMKGRAWFEVELREVTMKERPESQGGTWYLAKYMRVLGECVEHRCQRCGKVEFGEPDRVCARWCYHWVNDEHNSETEGYFCESCCPAVIGEDNG